MAEVTLKIPEDIKDIIEETSETIYVEAIKDIARKKIVIMQKRLKDIRKKVAVYEARYGKSCDEFSLSVPDTLKGHNDWIAWSYLVKVANELSNKIEKIKLLTGK